MTLYVSAPVPDARKRKQARTHSAESVRALIRLIQANTGPDGQTITQDQIAGLLGINPSTLSSYCTAPRKRTRSARGCPYTTLYCLEILALNGRATAAALWPVEAQKETA